MDEARRFFGVHERRGVSLLGRTSSFAVMATWSFVAISPLGGKETFWCR